MTTAAAIIAPHISVIHNGTEYCAYLTRGGDKDEFAMLKYTAFDKTLKGALQKLSFLLETDDVRFRPEIQIGAFAAFMLQREAADRFYLESLSVPLVYLNEEHEVMERTAQLVLLTRQEVLALGQVDSDAYLRRICAMTDHQLHLVMSSMGVAYGRGAEARLRRVCQLLALSQAPAAQAA